MEHLATTTMAEDDRAQVFALFGEYLYLFLIRSDPQLKGCVGSVTSLTLKCTNEAYNATNGKLAYRHAVCLLKFLKEGTSVGESKVVSKCVSRIGADLDGGNTRAAETSDLLV